MNSNRDRALEVETEGAGVPRAFRWRGRQVRVTEVLDDWEEAGCWWLGEASRQVHRVLGSDGALYELHHQNGVGWRLHRVFD